MAKIKLLNVLHEAKVPKDFWSDEHQQLLKVNRQKQIELNQTATSLQVDLSRLFKSIENTPFSDSYGNTYRIGSVNLIKTHPEREQPDDGIYKLKHTFNLNLWVEYRYYGDIIPPTVFQEPIKKMGELITEKYSQTYDLSKFKINIGNERMYYELSDSTGYHNRSGERQLSDMRTITPDDYVGSSRGMIEYTTNNAIFEQSLARLYFLADVKINQPTYDKETLDNKYGKIYNVLRKGDISLTRTNNEPIVAHYELREVEMENQRGFKYFTIPKYNYDTGEIDSSKVRVRLAQTLRVTTDNPDYAYRMGDIYMLVEKKLETKFKQFNIDLDIKFG